MPGNNHPTVQFSTFKWMLSVKWWIWNLFGTVMPNHGFAKVMVQQKKEVSSTFLPSSRCVRLPAWLVTELRKLLLPISPNTWLRVALSSLVKGCVSTLWLRDFPHRAKPHPDDNPDGSLCPWSVYYRSYPFDGLSTRRTVRHTQWFASDASKFVTQNKVTVTWRALMCLVSKKPSKSPPPWG